MTGYTPEKHNRWLDPPDFSSVTECRVCGNRVDIGDTEMYDGKDICRKCQPDYEPLCGECGKRFPMSQIILVKEKWCSYQFCLKCHKELGYED